MIDKHKYQETFTTEMKQEIVPIYYSDMNFLYFCRHEK
jgi:hypothetical protein